MLRSALTIALLAAVTAGCGGQQDKPRQRAAPTASGFVASGTGKLVGIGGGRSLYLVCEGAGSPTVVLEAGLGGGSEAWSAVQPQLARSTRTCSYDRAGLGSSLAIRGVHDAADEVADLERLLEHAQIAPPYVLVGHSYGGLLVRLFANAHRTQTAGVVLVDAVGRNQEQRLQAIWRARAPRQLRRLPKAVEDGVDIAAGHALGAQLTTLGDVPLAVVTHGRPEAGPSPLPRSVRGPAERLWSTMQDELAALSDDHVHVVARRAGHVVQDDQPDVVIRAVRAVTLAARTGARLAPCRRLFPGTATRCRG
jgi:pimeloyl-ACP methyl ester carboxylesterase